MADDLPDMTAETVEIDSFLNETLEPDDAEDDIPDNKPEDAIPTDPEDWQYQYRQPDEDVSEKLADDLPDII